VFIDAATAFSRQKSALTDQQSALRDFHFPLNGTSPGREHGAETHE
jgi:hypothetical protein